MNTFSFWAMYSLYRSSKNTILISFCKAILSVTGEGTPLLYSKKERDKVVIGKRDQILIENCNHCGGEARLVYEEISTIHHQAYIACKLCFINTPNCFGNLKNKVIQEVISIWNRRVDGR